MKITEDNIYYDHIQLNNGFKLDINIFLDEAYYEHVEPRPFAKEAINQLKNDYNIIFITARLSNVKSKQIVESTERWLKNNIINKQMPIFFVDKERLKLVERPENRFIVEDGIASLINLLKNGWGSKTIQLVTHYNKEALKLNQPPYAACNNWEEIYRTIKGGLYANKRGSAS